MIDYAKNSTITYMAITDLEGNYTYVSPFFTETFNLSSHDLIGTNSLRTIYYEDHAKCYETILKCFAHPMTLHKVVLRKPVSEHKLIWTAWEFYLNLDEQNQPVEILCYGHNITPIIEQKEQLHKIIEENDNNKIKYNSLFETASLGIVLHTPEGEILEANDSLCEMIQISQADICNHSMLDFINKNEHTNYFKSIKKQITNPTKQFFERELIKKDGGILPVSVNQRVYHDMNGNVYIWTLVKDISERKKQSDLLKHQKELLEQTTKFAHLGGWELDVQTLKTEWTSEVYKIYDLESEDPIYVDNAISYYHPEDQANITKAVEDAISNGISWELDLRLISASGRKKWVKTAGSPVYSNGKITSIKGYIQDITSQKINEDIIIQQHSLLKEIHFAQSHLIRLPLANILGLISLLDSNECDDDYQNILQKIKLSVQQLDNVIRDVASKDINHLNSNS